jgi:hypothetical protein
VAVPLVIRTRLGVTQDRARRDAEPGGIQRLRERGDGRQGDGPPGCHEGIDRLLDEIDGALSPWRIDLLMEPGRRVAIRE